jgi:transposase
MNRGELTNEQWERLQPLLPPQKAWTGQPAKDHRLIINALLWLARTGAPWRDLPERYGPWSTVASRFYRWQKVGIWQRILAELQAHSDAADELDGEQHYVDSTIIRAHQHAAGARGGKPETEALGRSQGGFGTKLHLRAEGQGKPMTLLLTPGQYHEAPRFEALMEQGAVKRANGRLKRRPKRIIADKGYTGKRIRQYLRERHIRVTIPSKRNQRRAARFDRARYRQRNLVERLINRLKQFRRIATRYEKRATNYLAMVTLVAILLWL